VFCPPGGCAGVLVRAGVYPAHSMDDRNGPKAIGGAPFQRPLLRDGMGGQWAPMEGNAADSGESRDAPDGVIGGGMEQGTGKERAAPDSCHYQGLSMQRRGLEVIQSALP
jgi:hypothetical protein